MKHLLPVLLALFLLTACGAPAGTAGPAPETVNSADFEEVDLTTVFDQDWGAGVPLPLDGETRAEYAVLLREQMETAYSVMADCTGLSIWPNRRELGEPWYDADGEAWYPFPGYAGVDEVRAAIQDAFTADSAAFLDRCLDPEGSPWLKDMDGGLWWRGSGYFGWGRLSAAGTLLFRLPGSPIQVGEPAGVCSHGRNGLRNAVSGAIYPAPGG